jgi:opacity protein-like surface antigen
VVDQVQSKAPEAGPESWYLLITAGYSKTRFEKDLELYNDWNRDLSFNLGMSAYGTLSDKFLLGGGFTAVGTVARYRGNGVNLHEKEDIVISGKIIHLDAKFFFDRIGTGLYVEGGIGFAEISVDDELKKEEVKDEERDHYSRFGVGFKWGGGFALELSKYETSFLVGINGYAIYAPGSRDKDPESPLKDLDKWGMKSTNLYIGILF